MRNYTVIFALLLITHRLQGQFVSSSLQAKIEEVSIANFYTHATLGVCVKDINTGKTIVDINADKRMVPASTVKLLTTFAAVDILGTSYKFKTQFGYNGVVSDDGILVGDIIIKPGNDPTLGSSRYRNYPDLQSVLSSIVDAFIKSGINCIQGNLIIDLSQEGSSPIVKSWMWEDLGNYYASGEWGLNFSENSYDVYLSRDLGMNSIAGVALVEPYIPGLKIVSMCEVGASDSGDQSYIIGGPNSFEKVIIGSIPEGKGLFKVKGAIPNPPSFFAYRLVKELVQKGVNIDGYTLNYKDKIELQNVLFDINSIPLEEIIKTTNYTSNNLYAESILKMIAYKLEGTKDFELASDVLVRHCTTYADMPDALYLEDGSGLSTRNSLTPRFLTNYLVQYALKNDINKIIKLLPAIGESGTLRNVLTNTPVKGNMFAKSGSMSRTLNYSGYCRTKSNRWVAFTVLLNNSTFKRSRDNRSEIEKILESIYLFY